MIDAPRIVQTEKQHAAVIHLTIPRYQFQLVFGPALGEVMAAVQAQGLQPTGPMFSHHFRMTPDTFDFEVGVPVAAKVAPKGRVKPGTLPATKVVRAVYRGGYEGLGSGWGELMQWMSDHGHAPAADLWECYLSGPESGTDPAQWRTELNRPLAA
jgi:effector-binding domain-containing protein